MIRALDEEIARVVRGRAANPKWIAGVMRHGYKGAFEIAATVDYLFAFAATTNAVKHHHFEQLYDAYLGDAAVRGFIAENNRAGAEGDRGALLARRSIAASGRRAATAPMTSLRALGERAASSRRVPRCGYSFGIDRRRNLEPDLDFVAVGIAEEDVGLAGHELALVADFSAGRDDRLGRSSMSAGSARRKPKCAMPPALPAFASFRSKTSTSRLPGVCAWMKLASR